MTQRAYRASEAGKAAQAAARARYNASAHGRVMNRARDKRRSATATRRAARARSRASDAGRAAEARRRARYLATVKGKAARARARVVARARYPERVRARMAVADALRRGTLVRPASCQACGERCQVEAHHAFGYGHVERLRVAWLCRWCHRGTHGAVRAS
jgi:hypothetical protein